ncbi:MAG: dUTP diphosphatase [Methyloprofundus sp.]|nr:dUTP diphosphatase [Methyloprofundus sp.]
MSLSTEQMFRHIVEMQIELNEKTVPGWLDKGLDWDAAILTEVAEAIDSTDWKWWKHTEADLANLRVEAIDLLHFLVSSNLQHAHRLVGYISFDHLLERIVFIYSYAQENHKDCEALGRNYSFLLKGIARESLNRNPGAALSHLFHVFFKLGMDDKSIYQAYITKNLLNHYRQERGYSLAAHGYKKIINGREDNVIFAEAVSLALAFYNKVSSVDGFDIKTLGQDETEGIGKAILANTSFKIHLKTDSPLIERIKELTFNLMDDAVNGGFLLDRFRSVAESGNGGNNLRFVDRNGMLFNGDTLIEWGSK